MYTITRIYVYIYKSKLPSPLALNLTLHPTLYTICNCTPIAVRHSTLLHTPYTHTIMQSDTPRYFIHHIHTPYAIAHQVQSDTPLYFIHRIHTPCAMRHSSLLYTPYAIAHQVQSDTPPYCIHHIHTPCAATLLFTLYTICNCTPSAMRHSTLLHTPYTHTIMQSDTPFYFIYTPYAIEDETTFWQMIFAELNLKKYALNLKPVVPSASQAKPTGVRRTDTSRERRGRETDCCRPRR